MMNRARELSDQCCCYEFCRDLRFLRRRAAGIQPDKQVGAKQSSSGETASEMPSSHKPIEIKFERLVYMEL